MANVPESQQIIPEDFKKDDQDAASKIAGSFNTYTEQLNEILDQNLTFTDNIRGELKILNYIAGETLKFKYGRKDKPVGLWLVNYRNLDTPTEILAVAVGMQWEQDGEGNITLLAVPGLTASETYQLTLLIISG
jgi:hypothetical protein